MSYIGPITQEILDSLVNEFKKKDTREKISKKIVNPLVKEISGRLFGYYVIHIILQITIIAILIYILLKFNKLKTLGN